MCSPQDSDDIRARWDSVNCELAQRPRDAARGLSRHAWLYWTVFKIVAAWLVGICIGELLWGGAA